MTDFPFVYETKLVSSTTVEKSGEQVIRILKIGEWLKEHVGDDNYISDIYISKMETQPVIFCTVCSSRGSGTVYSNVVLATRCIQFLR